MSRTLIKIITFFVLVNLLSACTSSMWNHAPPHNPYLVSSVVGGAAGAASGALIGGAIGSSAALPLGTIIGVIAGASMGGLLHHKLTLVNKLRYNGIQVVQIGDEVKLLLPSDRFFKPHSANLNPTYFPVLNLVADFLRDLTKVNIRISAYTSDAGSWHRNLALTRLQAQQIVYYLWHEKLDVRLIYAVGYGDAMPIANNLTARGRAENRRVEITLRKVG